MGEDRERIEGLSNEALEEHSEGEMANVVGAGRGERTAARTRYRAGC